MVLASILSSSRLDFEEERESQTHITPRSEAFSIWSVIYCLLLFENEKGRVEERHLLEVAVGLTVLWPFLFKRRLLFPSFLLLLVSSILAIASTKEEASFGGQMFAGWICLATALSFFLWREDSSEREEFLLLCFLCISLCAASFAWKRPLLVLPAAWGVYWMKDEIRKKEILFLLLSSPALSGLSSLQSLHPPT